MVLTKGLKPSRILLAIISVRLLSVFVVQTWYVPDEYWQTLEVAHKHAFGYGELTWEWQKGIRSYLVPSIVTLLYTILKYTGLDYPEALIYLPRILQALLSSAADYSFYKWSGDRKWAAFLSLSSWFWFYCSSRTLLQTTETALIAIALSVFPFKTGRMGHYEKENNTWVWIACVCSWIRPTSFPVWLVLGSYHLYTTNQGRLHLLTRTILPIAVITAAAMIALDSFFYGDIVVTPWGFFRYNVLQDVASFYGTHPWYWYWTQGLPAVLGINLLPCIWGITSAVRRPEQNKTGVVILAAALVQLLVYSFVPHKEFRFVLPLLFIFLYLAQDVIVPWSRKAKPWQLYTVTLLIVVGNSVPAVYFSQIHQSGPLQLMPLLRESVQTNNKSSITFLMPCHSTPLYSHLHANITTRYLHCDPPLPGETDESEAFFNNPQRWWRLEYAHKQTPSHVVMFHVLRGRIEPMLSGYKLVHELPHTQFPEKEVSEKILVFQKAESARKPIDEAV